MKKFFQIQPRWIILPLFDTHHALSARIYSPASLVLPCPVPKLYLKQLTKIFYKIWPRHKLLPLFDALLARIFIWPRQKFFPCLIPISSLALPRGEKNVIGSSKRKKIFPIPLSIKFYSCLIPIMPYLQEFIPSFGWHSRVAYVPKHYQRQNLKKIQVGLA